MTIDLDPRAQLPEELERIAREIPPYSGKLAGARQLLGLLPPPLAPFVQGGRAGGQAMARSTTPYGDAASGPVGQLGLGAVLNGSVGTSQLGDGAVTAEKMLAGDYSNCVTNPGFETGDLSGWDTTEIDAGSTAVISADSPHAGKQCCLLHKATLLCVLESTNRVRASVGDTVAVSGWAKSTVGASPTVALGFQCYDVNGAALGYVYTDFSITTSWAYYSAGLTPQANTVEIAFVVGNNVNNSTVAVDDLNMARGGVAVDAGGLTIFNGKLNLVDANGETVLDALGFQGNWLDFLTNGVAHSTFTDGVLGNLIPYGNPAGGPNTHLPGWNMAWGSLSELILETGSELPSGKNIQFQTSAQNGYLTLWSNRVPIMAGHAYSAYLLANVALDEMNPNYAEGTWWITFYKADGATISWTAGGTVGNLLYFNAGTGFQGAFFGQAVQAPSNARYAVVQIKLEEHNAHGQFVADIGAVGLVSGDNAVARDAINGWGSQRTFTSGHDGNSTWGFDSSEAVFSPVYVGQLWLFVCTYSLSIDLTGTCNFGFQYGSTWVSVGRQYLTASQLHIITLAGFWRADSLMAGPGLRFGAQMAGAANTTVTVYGGAAYSSHIQGIPLN